QYQYDARRQQGDGGGVFGDNQFTSTLSVNFHFPRIPRRTLFIHLTLLTHMQTTECTFRPKSQSFATSNDCASSKSIQSIPKE
ncbi:hypothetical protein, partial [Aeromonas caviae]|uniref:hypothetical protein n=1 Tax=Aeromonas caviae TaxID=648 RepID=UPI002B45F590